MDQRGRAFARLFEAVHEGVYIGTLGPGSTTTIAANPHLKLVFGYPSEAPETVIPGTGLSRASLPVAPYLFGAGLAGRDRERPTGIT